MLVGGVAGGAVEDYLGEVEVFPILIVALELSRRVQEFVFTPVGSFGDLWVFGKGEKCVQSSRNCIVL